MRADRIARRAEEAVLVGHLFAQGGEECPDSERPLVVGGVAQVGASALSGWSYVALGHLHRPQCVGGRQDVRYSGSLLPYSFGEAEQQKSVALVELMFGGAAVRTLPLTARRALVRLESSFHDLLHHPRFAFAAPALVEATYTDTGYIIDAAARLRQRFPHLLTVLPKQIVRQVEGTALPAAGLRDAEALLRGFYAYVEDGDVEDAAVQAFQKALEQAERGQGGNPCALAS